jgi:anti-anti-sigma regulatory factor
MPPIERTMNIPSEILLGRTAHGPVIRVVGRGTMNESYAFRAAAESNIDRGTVVFDATQCEYLDSTFLGCLIAIHKSCEQSPGRQFVIAASPATRIKLFSTSSLNKFFNFVEACPDPIDELEPLDIDQLDRQTLGQHVMRCHERLAERGGHEAATFRSIANQLRDQLGDTTSE